jgi:hypothetical protein
MHPAFSLTAERGCDYSERFRMYSGMPATLEAGTSRCDAANVLFQRSIGSDPLARTVKEIYAEALDAARRDFEEAREAVQRDDSKSNQTRYCEALFKLDRLQATFPFLAAGITLDAEV